MKREGNRDARARARAPLGAVGVRVMNQLTFLGLNLWLGNGRKDLRLSLCFLPPSMCVYVCVCVCMHTHTRIRMYIYV